MIVDYVNATSTIGAATASLDEAQTHGTRADAEAVAAPGERTFVVLWDEAATHLTVALVT